MPARDRLVTALAWVLCASAVLLLGLAVFLRLVTRPDAAAEQALGPVVVSLGLASFPLVGAVIAVRLPRNPYGWLWCAVGVASGLLAVALAVEDSPARDSAWVAVSFHVGFLSLPGLLVFVFLLFPTGRVPSRGWRWLARGTIALGALLVLATPLAPAALASGPSVSAPTGVVGRLLTEFVRAGLIGMLVLVLVGMVSLIPRFRRAGTIERQQLKWFVLATAINALYFAVDQLTAVSVKVGAGWVLTHVLVGALIPAAVGVAVLRYRLYEIDRIVSRTVSYGLLTGALVVLYLVAVAVLRPLLEPLTGGSALAVAGSTLAVAAVFNPARRRLQAVVDRRFDRARYDAARAVDAFAARLRDQVDLDEVAAGLRDTVATTVAPTRISVWLRPGQD